MDRGSGQCAERAPDGRRHGGLLPGRHLLFLVRTTVATARLGEHSLAPSHAGKTAMARKVLQASWRQVSAHLAFHCDLSPCRNQHIGRDDHDAMAGFYFFNFTGSAASTISYILLGYFFGRKWQRFEALLGPLAIYLILAAIALMVVGVMFRRLLIGIWSPDWRATTSACSAA
jgi:hypothetical protein